MCPRYLQPILHLLGFLLSHSLPFRPSLSPPPSEDRSAVMEQEDDKKNTAVQLERLLEALRASARSRAACKDGRPNVAYDEECREKLRETKISFIKGVIEKLRMQRRLVGTRSLSLPGLPLPASSLNSDLEVAYVLALLFGDSALAAEALPADAIKRASLLLTLSLCVITPATTAIVKRALREVSNNLVDGDVRIYWVCTSIDRNAEGVNPIGEGTIVPPASRLNPLGLQTIQATYFPSFSDPQKKQIWEAGCWATCGVYTFQLKGVMCRKKKGQGNSVSRRLRHTGYRLPGLFYVREPHTLRVAAIDESPLQTGPGLILHNARPWNHKNSIHGHRGYDNVRRRVGKRN